MIAHPVLSDTLAKNYRWMPRIAGYYFTSIYSTTRRLGTFPDDVCPIGARRVPLADVHRVKAAYVWGDADPTVLVLHGWGTDSTSMMGIVETAAALGESVVCFDAPGHGVSPGGQATMSEYAMATVEVLRRFPTIRTVVCHSLGCIAAVSAIATVGVVRSLIMLAPACTLAGTLERWADERNLPNGLVAEMYRELQRRNGVPVSHWDIRTLGLPQDLEAVVLRDPDDDWIPASDAQQILEAYPQIPLRDVAGTGHHGILRSPLVKAALASAVGHREGDRL
ncbi:alpha/beta hydrolase [Rhodococcus sp. ABRD24]|uniref:alpha/beta fold hydrolase n=1 Tax=Rhodococcus sp. ABRD24 TaxID=2507582 RepID=UPI00103E6D14|nr:alpha/beta hydrolase [Rhodococcus sp. ABRD24]QBJ98122.1 alpha/beta hydrolase [Rhodococcus sp. ABRD24]